MIFKNKLGKATLLLGAVVAAGLIYVFSFPYQASKNQKQSHTQEKHIVIVGGGHVGLIEAYLASLRAQKSGEKVRITIYEKNASTKETTAANIWNSHTPDEIISVVPRGPELEEKLAIAFNQPGGIRVTDVAGVNDSECTHRFIEQVKAYGKDEEGHQKRTQALLKLGKAGMMLWKKFYETADPDLKTILQECNFNPCTELASQEEASLHKGYRIDLIYDIPNAKDRATSMMKTYQELGYKSCKTLTPDEVVSLDPSLAQFCKAHSHGEPGKREWNEDSVALWRPGGCLHTQDFLPKFAAYLEKKGNFKIIYNKKVVGVIYDDQDPHQVKIKGLKFEDGTQIQDEAAAYILCPGEAVGTLTHLGFSEPAYAGFAGTSLYLNVPVTAEQLNEFKDFAHCMEVHKVGVVLAWQAKIRDGNIFLGGAGTKAFYGDKQPTIHEAFAKDRNLLQLRMFNDVLPQVVSIALNRDTKGQQLTAEDMALLEKKGIAKRWVGRRAVTYDGFPTLGHLYHQGKRVANGRTTTSLSSGGGSFSLITSLISHSSLAPEETREELEKLNLNPSFIQEVLSYADSRRVA